MSYFPKAAFKFLNPGVAQDIYPGNTYITGYAGITLNIRSRWSIGDTVNIYTHGGGVGFTIFTNGFTAMIGQSYGALPNTFANSLIVNNGVNVIQLVCVFDNGINSNLQYVVIAGTVTGN